MMNTDQKYTSNIHTIVKSIAHRIADIEHEQLPNWQIHI